MRNLLSSLLALCLLPLCARAQNGPGWKITSSETLPAPADGVAHHVVTLGRSPRAAGDDGATEATLHFVSFDAGECTFRTLDQNSRNNASAAETLAANGCIAGTNGGYFTEEFDPLGLLVCDGRVVHPAQKNRLLTGVLAVTATNHVSLRRISAEGTAAIAAGKHVRQAVQCGPFLVEDRRPVPGLNGVRAARRTGVFTDGGGRWGLVVCSPVTLEEFGAILAEPALLPGGLKIARALNLDGGGSTALWVRKGGEPSPMAERGYVRDFVGIVPRVPAPGRKP